MELIHASLDDIEAWLEDVSGVLAALSDRHETASSGQLIWLSGQTRLATEALDALDHVLLVAEEDGSPVDEIQWLHTRVCAVMEALTGSGAEPAAAA